MELKLKLKVGQGDFQGSGGALWMRYGVSERFGLLATVAPSFGTTWWQKGGNPWKNYFDEVKRHGLWRRLADRSVFCGFWKFAL
jgi:hypothetical protein